MSKSFPSVVRYWVGLFALIKVYNRIIEKCWADLGRMVDNRIAAWSKVRVSGRPSVVWVCAPDVDEWGVLIPVRVLGFFRVAQEGDGFLVDVVLFVFIFLTILLSVSLPHIVGISKVNVRVYRIVR